MKTIRVAMPGLAPLLGTLYAIHQTRLVAMINAALRPEEPHAARALAVVILRKLAQVIRELVLKMSLLTMETAVAQMKMVLHVPLDNAHPEMSNAESPWACQVLAMTQRLVTLGAGSGAAILQLLAPMFAVPRTNISLTEHRVRMAAHVEAVTAGDRIEIVSVISGMTTTTS